VKLLFPIFGRLKILPDTSTCQEFGTQEWNSHLRSPEVPENEQQNGPSRFLIFFPFLKTKIAHERKGPSLTKKDKEQ